MKKVVALLSVLALISTNAFAALSTELSTPVTDISGYWDTIKAVVVGVVVFGIGIAFLKRLRSR